MKEFIWYDVNENSFIIFNMDLGTAVMEGLKGNCPKQVKRIETNKLYNRGRLIGIDNSILEYIGEL